MGAMQSGPAPALGCTMRSFTTTVLTLCALIASACAAQTDSTKARDELRKTIEAAVEKHPEIGDLKALVAGRVKGKNGWEDFKKLALDWKATSEGEAAPAWVSVFMAAEQLKAEPYTEQERRHLRAGFDATAAASLSAAKLFSSDCIVPPPEGPNEDAQPSAVNTASAVFAWFQCLSTRAVVACVLGMPTLEIKSAVELAYKLAMKFDEGWSILGRLVTRAFRVSALETGLSIAETQSDRGALLLSLRSIAPTRMFSPRDAWLADCAYQVELFRQWLKKTDVELEKQSESIHQVTGKTAPGLLQWAKRYLEMECAMLAHIPSHVQFGKPQDAKQVVNGYEAVSNGKPQLERDPVRVGVKGLVQSDLRESMCLAVLDLRIDESRTGSLPDADGLKRLLAAYDGLKVQQTDAGVEVSVADDHPVLKLFEGKDRVPRQQVKRWSKK